MPSKKEQYKYAKHGRSGISALLLGSVHRAREHRNSLYATTRPRTVGPPISPAHRARRSPRDENARTRGRARMEWAFRTGREQLIVIGSPLSKSTPPS